MTRWISFAIFITVVITVYSLLNYYFIHKHKNILTLKTTPVLILRLLLFTLILTPIATIIFSRYEQTAIAAITGFAGYSWLAFLGLFLGIHGIFDISLFVAERNGMKPSESHTRAISATAVIVSLLILFYGAFEADNIQIKNIAIKTDKFRSGERIRIMQISDVHFSPMIGGAMAQTIKEIADEQQPDLIVSTGDILDPGIKQRNEIVATLSEIKPPLGKFAIMGNHEFYTTEQYSKQFISDSGFTLLRNKSINIRNNLTVAGVDDPAIKRVKDAIIPPIQTYLSPKTRDRYTVLLKHQPRIEENSENFFDLQLSGHTHGGQIFPFNFFVRLVYPYMYGIYELKGGAVLYVSRGAGTWGPPFRFMARPEVVIVDVVSVN